jgi:hypothetical protein
MVIEMLLNNDIPFFFNSNDFTLSKGNECNYDIIDFLFFLNHFI